MISRILLSLGAIALAALFFAAWITRDGEPVVPTGDGVVTLDGRDFEAFPLLDDAARFVTDGYRSYFVEVEPGIKVHVLEVGSGFPLLLLHGNPTSGFLYRKVAAALPTDRVRVIMPTLVVQQLMDAMLWPFGAALAFILSIAGALVVYVYFRLTSRAIRGIA